MVFHEPDAFEAHFFSKAHLGENILKELILASIRPGFRELNLVDERKFHAQPPLLPQALGATPKHDAPRSLVPYCNVILATWIGKSPSGAKVHVAYVAAPLE